MLWVTQQQHNQEERQEEAQEKEEQSQQDHEAQSHGQYQKDLERSPTSFCLSNLRVKKMVCIKFIIYVSGIFNSVLGFSVFVFFLYIFTLTRSPLFLVCLPFIALRVAPPPILANLWRKLLFKTTAKYMNGSEAENQEFSEEPESTIDPPKNEKRCCSKLVPTSVWTIFWLSISPFFVSFLVAIDDSTDQVFRTRHLVLGSSAKSSSILTDSSPYVVLEGAWSQQSEVPKSSIHYRVRIVENIKMKRTNPHL
jgi:hypothetical protein